MECIRESSGKFRSLPLPFVLATFIAWLNFTGCATPDLAPFASASSTLAGSVKQGGNLAINPITQRSMWVGDQLVAPSDENHPAKALRDQWGARLKTMDAVIVYSASLAAISDASAKRKENATQLVDSVKKLASAVPGINVGAGPAGDLMISGLGMLVEVKAWHDMAKAVAAADPAIQKIAEIIAKDMASLRDLFESPIRADIARVSNALRPVDRTYAALQNARQNLRVNVAADPNGSNSGDALTRLDTLAEGVRPELESLREEREDLEDNLASGKEFFDAAIKGIEAWAQTHTELAAAFKENRRPNLVLLAARAEELNTIITELRK
jgi:hypothetical protein